ncbi:MAG: hypothetical protein HQL38_11750 [Alphaproteobacteria bacterium]|nr:hypothetical protein [Alphaproteobacteria bacterium]
MTLCFARPSSSPTAMLAQLGRGTTAGRFRVLFAAWPRAQDFCLRLAEYVTNGWTLETREGNRTLLIHSLMTGLDAWDRGDNGRDGLAAMLAGTLDTASGYLDGIVLTNGTVDWDARCGRPLTDWIASVGGDLYTRAGEYDVCHVRAGLEGYTLDPIMVAVLAESR